jgi:hypothetical protein
MILGLLPSNIPREKIPPEGLVILFLAYSPGAFPTNSIDLLRWFQMCEQMVPNCRLEDVRAICEEYLGPAQWNSTEQPMVPNKKPRNFSSMVAHLSTCLVFTSERYFQDVLLVAESLVQGQVDLAVSNMANIVYCWFKDQEFNQLHSQSTSVEIILEKMSAVLKLKVPEEVRVPMKQTRGRKPTLRWTPDVTNKKSGKRKRTSKPIPVFVDNVSEASGQAELCWN